MKPLVVACVLISLLVLSSPAVAGTPTWAKNAASFPEECWPEESGLCTSVRIPSPDGKSSIEVRYTKKIVEDEEMLVAYLRVSTHGKRVREAALHEGYQRVDLLWSPDSKAFFVNGGDGGSYWGFFVYVYLLSDEPLKRRNLTHQAQRDMAKTFPPCKAAYLLPEDCKVIEPHPEYHNMSGIDWIGSSAIVVLAEVPCSGMYGGIGCQVMGYELEIPTGRILKRIGAAELKRDWQKSMAWEFEIPDPPEYCDKSSGKATPGCE